MVFDESKFTWPESFEKYYKTWPYHSTHVERRLRSSVRYPEVEPERYPMKSFFGSCQDDDKDAHFFGRMHAIPPQGGIPGFQRITFLKFFHWDGEYNPDSIWAYEGCVLPGNQIIVGRWWWISGRGGISEDDVPSGPFMFWNVDESEADPPLDMKDAMEFYEQMKSHPDGLH